MINAIKSFLVGNVTAIYLVVGAAALGFGGGLYVHSKFDAAEVTSQLQTKIKDDKKSVELSNKAEQGIVDGKDAVEVKYVYKTKEIIKYVPETVYTECIDKQGNTVSTTLSVGAVRLLNSDDAAGVQPASVGDAEVRTPTEIGLQELSKYILVIKKQYEELAINHDGLVDYNNGYKKLTNQ